MDTTPPPPPATRILIDPSVLEDLRKQYKRKASDLDRILSHKSFLEDCSSKDVIPVGLSIKTTCNALAAETDVTDQFNRVILDCERRLIQVLYTHSSRLETTRRTNSPSLSRRCPISILKITPETRQLHQTILDKTKKNLRKANKRRQRNKQLKMKRIEQGSSRHSQATPTGIYNR